MEIIPGGLADKLGSKCELSQRGLERFAQRGDPLIDKYGVKAEQQRRGEFVRCSYRYYRGDLS